MKPFSKNLFSQTPVAFGWLPKETINLDISMSVWACVCVCVAWMWVGDLRCFVLLQRRNKLELKQINKRTSRIAPTPEILWNTKPSYHASFLPIITPHLHPNSLPQTPPQNILLCQHLTAPSYLPPPKFRPARGLWAFRLKIRLKPWLQLWPCSQVTDRKRHKHWKKE